MAKFSTGMFLLNFMAGFVNKAGGFGSFHLLVHTPCRLCST